MTKDACQSHHCCHFIGHYQCKLSQRIDRPTPRISRYLFSKGSNKRAASPGPSGLTNDLVMWVALQNSGDTLKLRPCLGYEVEGPNPNVSKKGGHAQRYLCQSSLSSSSSSYYQVPSAGCPVLHLATRLLCIPLDRRIRDHYGFGPGRPLLTLHSANLSCSSAARHEESTQEHEEGSQKFVPRNLLAHECGT